MWVVILALVAAVVTILVTQFMKGGAKEIDRSTFQQYVENAQYYKDGKPNEVNGQIVSTTAKDENSEPVVLKGYKVKDGVIVSEDEKSTLTVIWKVATDDYEYTGYTKNAKGGFVKSYYCYGPSAYGGESWDSPTLNSWNDMGGIITQANPNAGSWVSTAFSVL